MAKRGFFYSITDELENNANIHRALIEKIERKTGRRLICYIANPFHPQSAIQDHDPDVLENVIRSEQIKPSDGKLDLLIASPGGLPYAAGKMVKVCRTFSAEFRTIVVTRAMSAATLLCLGSDELIMTETANLGPIDPQIVRLDKGNQRLPQVRLWSRSNTSSGALSRPSRRDNRQTLSFTCLTQSISTQSLKASKPRRNEGRGTDRPNVF